jgi:dGTPase
MDRVAYINHDIDDALRAGALSEEELPAGPIAVLGDTGSQRIDTLVHDMVEHSARAGAIVQGAEAGEAMAQLRAFMFERVYLGPAVRAEHERIAGVVRRLFEHYVEHPQALPAGVSTPGEHSTHAGASATTGSLSSSSPPFSRTSASPSEGAAAPSGPALARAVTDYLAGMTDRYCIRAYTELQVPRAFAR